MALLGVVVGIAALPLLAGHQALVNSDWTAFATGGRLAVSSSPDGLYNRAAQVRTQSSLTGGARLLTGDRRDLLPFNQPPWLAVLNAPFAAMGTDLGARAWMLLSVAALVAGLLLLALVAGSPWQALPAMASVPTALMVVNAQVDGLVVLGLGLAAWLWRRDRVVLAGCALGICLAKPHLVLGLALLLIVARQWRLLAGWAMAAAALLAVVAIQDWRWPLQWLVFDAGSAGRIGTELSPGGAVLNLPIGRGLAAAGAVAITALVVGVVALLVRRRQAEPWRAEALLVAGSLLASPHALSSDLVLASAALVLWGQARWFDWAGLSLFAAVAAVFHDTPAATISGVVLVVGVVLRVGFGRRLSE